MDTAVLFKEYLKEEEIILWTGQPKRGIQIRDADLILIPMSIILIGFSIILDYTLVHYNSGIFFKLFGGLLALAGIELGLIRFIMDAARRASTFYCITNKRIIVLTGKRKRLIKTLPLKNIDRMEITEENDGSGFIIFGNTNPLYPWLLGGFYFTTDSVPGLELLPDVKNVYRIINKQIKVDLTPGLAAEIRKEDRKDLN
ncbi:MAG: hypothetical protein WBB36_08050 [Chitinophagales bacterium]